MATQLTVTEAGFALRPEAVETKPVVMVTETSFVPDCLN